MTRPASRRAPEVPWLLLALAVAAVLTSCYEPQSERLSCDDVLPAGSYDFSQIQTLIQDHETSSSPRRLTHHVS